MTENPYAAPLPFAPSPAIGVKSGQLADLQAVARYQKGVMVCILLYFCCLAGAAAVPQEFAFLFGLAILAVIVTGAACVVLLALKVYGALQGILMGVIALVPCFGLLPLLLINAKATQVLRQNGVHVGFFGADARSLPQNPFGPPS